MFALLSANPCAAQHASDDPVASADDAFGLTQGLESIGLYNPGNIRGFNPQTAGNVRVDGLYFDQQGGLSNRVVEGSTIRVGIGETGYAFPAPTGIVDYDLRHVGNGDASASLVVTAGPFQGQGTSFDGIVPLGSSALQVPIGVSDQFSMQNNGVGSALPGYTSRVKNIGATPFWRVDDRITIRLLLDWTQTSQAKTASQVYASGDFLPPTIQNGYLGQSWAEGRSLAKNVGGLIHVSLLPGWSLAAGVFRSTYDVPVSYADLYLNSQLDGVGTHAFVANPDQSTSSNSGEVRLTGRFGSGAWRHEVVFMARGRDTISYYGGSDFVTIGNADIGQLVAVPKPAFEFSERTRDVTHLWSAGAGYRVQWEDHGELEFGLQREIYEKVVDAPGLAESHLGDKPARGYARAAEALTDRITGYVGYAQGLEDSGTAPSGATNRGAILPDARTWQDDAGLQLKLADKLKAIAGVFEIQKPYFNFDTTGADRMLGLQRAEGLETSVSGELIEDLNVTAGALFGAVRVAGPNLKAEGVGPIAFGQPREQGSLSLDYKLHAFPGVSLDATVIHYGRVPASVDNLVYNPPLTFVLLGGRYRFKWLGRSATFRVQLQNATNATLWNLGLSPGFSQIQPRSVFSYLTVDL